MKVRLTRTARITHQPGEIVEVSPAELAFLVSVGSAVEVAVKMPDAEPKTEKRATTKKK
jgi:hypothetical protein